MITWYVLKESPPEVGSICYFYDDQTGIGFTSEYNGTQTATYWRYEILSD